MNIQIKRSDLGDFCAPYPLKDGTSKADRREAYFEAMVECQPDLDAAGITERANRLVDFMAQTGHECSLFTIDEESLYYTTTSRLKAVWPTRFRTTAQALPYVRRPKALANKVYGGRMGNQNVRNGGWLYRGRGALQTTGFHGYNNRAKSLGDEAIVKTPDIVANDKVVSIRCAIDEWTKIGGNGYSDRNQFRKLTRRINGGYNGMSDRWRKRKLADKIWGDQVPSEGNVQAISVSAIDKRPDILEPGDEGERVKALQRRLVALGYQVGAIDGKFGQLTEDAVVLYKQHHELNKAGLDPEEVDQALFDLIDSEDAPRAPELARTNETARDVANRGSRTMSILLWVRGTFAFIFGGTALGAAGDYVPEGLAGPTVVQTLTTMKSTLTPIAGILRWITSEPWLLGACGAFLALWLASRLIAWRLSDHQSGKNKGR